ncbi:gamma-parvin isoform X1 [Phycodurus eques]|uniref:gamma-parvin isoform X1 n=1 Tax=Phycodurus eques TaxID=693459 RepID=UPI002ACEBF3D|nr:gamma-parvin isoform X1 [Phycodurus eques]XP_061533979.1 gamma-parvin isoform X1 [Phycodurus eques]XP_061533980.1 gamma-parvin isoform X1 [Phycodurus eques]
MEADVSQNHNEEEEEEPVDADCFQVVRTKMIQPTSRKDPKVEKLTEALLDWINSTLKTEHIVVQSLDEDLYDGLVLHHLLARLAGVRLSLEEIALTSSAQIRKLEAVMEELDKRLDQSDTKWDVSRIHNKDLLATLHLLVAMVRCFQPELVLPSNVNVQVVVMEVRRKGMRSDVQTEVLTGDSTNVENLSCTDGGVNAVEQLLKLGAHKVAVVKQALVDFVNKSLASLGLHVSDVDKQFSDGVILLLLIGQLEGFFIPLCDFSLIPVNNEQMLHNVTFALSLLTHAGLHVSSVQPQDFVAREVAATLKVLYALFCKHARQEEKTSVVFL